jgi:5'-phosphate synthase pdxT subunit
MQGAIEEHEAMLRKMQISTLRVKKPTELLNIDGIVFPGGESTTMLRLMGLCGLVEPLIDWIGTKRLPVFGTCAGMIILAKAITNYPNQKSLELMDIRVERNAFGRQIDSFEAPIQIDGFGSEPFQSVFIRAPLIRDIGTPVKVMATYREEPVMARQDNILVSSFHPELTTDTRVHQYFLNMVKEWRLSQNLAVPC